MPGTPSGSRASIRGTRAPLVLRVSPRRARWPRTAQRPPPRQGRVPGRGPAGGEGRPADAPRPEGACLASRTGSGPAHLQVVLGKFGVAAASVRPGRHGAVGLDTLPGPGEGGELISPALWVGLRPGQAKAAAAQAASEPHRCISSLIPFLRSFVPPSTLCGPIGALFILGKYSTTELLYNGVRYTLTRPGDKPCPRVGHSCSYLPPAGDAKRGKVFIVGGANPNQSFSDVHIMDLETRTWTTPEVSSPPPSPRTFHTSAAAIGNQLYVFGGGERGDQPVQDVKLHVFDASNMKWQKLSPTGAVPAGCAAHAAVAVGKHVYMFGGMTPSGALNTMYKYHTEKQHWTSLQFDTFLPPGRLDHSMCVIPWPVMSTSENEDSDSVILKCEAEKGDAADIQVAQGGGLPEESQTNMLLCFVFGGMNTEGEIYDDCFVTVVD
ncbi:Rab9 effector protein with kelch motifs [Cricetulus griseus]